MANLRVANREQALLVIERLKFLQELRDQKFGSEEFQEQLAFIYDDSPLGSALCTRRAGKSYGVGEKLFKKGYDFPGYTVLYLALTRDSAKRIMWRDVLKDIARRNKIEVRPNETNLELLLPCNSIIKLAGVDASEKEREKVLGGKYPYVAIDEAGSFGTDLEALVYEYLEPAVSDFDGSIDLIGTPTFNWQGFFCKVTEGREPGWSNHTWDTSDNPFMKENWAKRLALLLERNPMIEETPGFRRMYKAEWVKDTDNLVYKYNSALNLIDKLPDPKEFQIRGQVLGIDLGFNDATAYSLGRYYDNDNVLYIIDTWKKSGQIVDHVVDTIKSYIEDYDIHNIVIDNASKQVVETLKARFNLYDVVIKAAEKTDKMEFIGFMNSDLQMGRIKLLKGEKTAPLSKEYVDLIYDPRAKKKVEHPACENHLCDATLYMWREARNYMERPLDPEIPIEDKIEMELERDFEKQERRNADDWDDFGSGSWE